MLSAMGIRLYQGIVLQMTLELTFYNADNRDKLCIMLAIAEAMNKIGCGAALGDLCEEVYDALCETEQCYLQTTGS